MTVLYNIYQNVNIISFLKGCTTRFGNYEEAINSTTNDVEYRDMDLQLPIQPPNAVHAQRLTVGDDGELLLVSDNS